jgi:hypothetical protein
MLMLFDTSTSTGTTGSRNDSLLVTIEGSSAKKTSITNPVILNAARADCLEREMGGRVRLYAQSAYSTRAAPAASLQGSGSVTIVQFDDSKIPPSI